MTTRIQKQFSKSPSPTLYKEQLSDYTKHLTNAEWPNEDSNSPIQIGREPSHLRDILSKMGMLQKS